MGQLRRAARACTSACAQFRTTGLLLPRSRPKPRKRRVVLLGCILCLLLSAIVDPKLQAQDTASPDAHPDLTRLSLEDLTNVEFTSLSKRPEKYTDVAAAVFVITHEDIRH